MVAEHNAESPGFGEGRLIAMLTTQELTDARERLCQAKALVTGVRDLFFSGGDVSGARLLNEVVHALADEIAAIDKKLAAQP
jgi:hypothetical protein